jgi:thioredoxin reductase
MGTVISAVGVEDEPRRTRERRGDGVGVLEADDEREEAGDDMVVVGEECRAVSAPFYTAESP